MIRINKAQCWLPVTPWPIKNDGRVCLPVTSIIYLVKYSVGEIPAPGFRAPLTTIPGTLNLAMGNFPKILKDKHLLFTDAYL
jgi:hypothetical protein